MYPPFTVAARYIQSRELSATGRPTSQAVRYKRYGYFSNAGANYQKMYPRSVSNQQVSLSCSNLSCVCYTIVELYLRWRNCALPSGSRLLYPLLFCFVSRCLSPPEGERGGRGEGRGIRRPLLQRLNLFSWSAFFVRRTNFRLDHSGNHKIPGKNENARGLRNNKGG